MISITRRLLGRSSAALVCVFATLIVLAPRSLCAQAVGATGEQPAAAVGSAPAAEPARSVNTHIDPHDAQNPVASVISLPFQNNAYFDVGPLHKTADVLIVEPVIPFKLNDDWNLITRTILPVINLPQLSPSGSSTTGLGPLQPQLYFSPTHPGKFIWGAGAQLWLPTATDKALGPNRWGAGPALAVLTIRGPWVAGFLANNVWVGYFGSNSNREHVNQLTFNPFVNYNLTRGWYVSSSPVMTANWLAAPSQRFSVPVGGGVGRLFRIAGLPVNTRIQAFNYVKRPAYTATWLVQAQIQFLFPASKRSQ